MKIFKKTVSFVLTLLVAQSFAVTSYAFETKNISSNSQIQPSYDESETISANEISYTLSVGQTFQITDKISISNSATFLSFSSNNTTVATVTSKGKVSAKSAGKADITIKTSDNRKMVCKINVKTAPESITLNKTSINMGVGQIYTLISSLAPSDSVTYCSWSSDNKSVATVDNNGNIKAINKGIANITVKTSNGKTATCKINVKTAPTKITLDKYSLTLALGQTYTLTKTLTPSNSFASYTWSSSNNNVATVNSNGKIATKGVGVAYITVKTYNGKSVTCQVTVKTPPTSVHLNKTSINLNEGKSMSLLATLSPANAFTYCNWSSSDTSIATVDSKGTVKAIKKGVATITVRTSNGKTSSCKVNVNAPNTLDAKTIADIDETIKLVNIQRQKAGLNTLVKRDDVCEISQIRASEIYNSFSHIRPNGQNCFSLFTEYNIPYYYAGENLAAGFNTPESVVNGWMNSAGHKANILNPNFTGVGIGIYEKNGVRYWVQTFIG